MKNQAEKFYSKDGRKNFPTKQQADEYDEREELLKRVTQIANGTPDAILKWFEENFRVPPPKAAKQKETESAPAAQATPERPLPKRFNKEQ